MPRYLIEFRLHGYAKRYAKTIIFDIARKFKVSGITRNWAVPHITLYGPFTTNKERAMVSTVKDVSENYGLVPFKVKGFGCINKNHQVVHLDIAPTDVLKRLRWELAQRLHNISDTYQPWDSERDYLFHSTVAFRDINDKFASIWEYIKQKDWPNINQYLLRITIIKSGLILCEYDLIQKRMLNRLQALDRNIMRRTISILKRQQKVSKL